MADNNLSADLHQIAKKILRGRYDKIAAAVWRHDALRKHIVAIFSKEINRECERMCQLKLEPSILRMSPKDDMLAFSFKKVDEELSAKAPLLRTVLMAATLRRSKSPDINGRWLPIVSTAAAVCFKGRSKFLTAMQLLISTIVQHSSYSASKIVWHETLCLMVSHKYFNRKLDEFGHDHDKAIKQKIENKVNAIKQKVEVLPSYLDHVLQQKHYIYLVARIITKYAPCLQFLQKSVPKHIPHPYSNEMTQQTNTTFLGVIYENENFSEGIVKVLQDLQQYQPACGE
ncbi:uncharacterized protein LOC135683861 [Rhopilema esculentum]|uniref:uncharacterized protein LOC135683861 n=1 Tax=Rhopilema esculentum TaxID=499914 RepID=UPI0031D996FD